MSVVTEFELKLKDMLSGPLHRLQTVSRSTFGGIDQILRGTQHHLNMTGVSVNDLKKRIELLTQKRDIAIGTEAISAANRELAILEGNLRRVTTMGAGGAMGGERRAEGGLGMMGVMEGTMLGQMAFEGIIRGVEAGKEFIGDSLEKGMELEHTKLSMNIIKRSDKAGGELFEQVHENLLKSLYGTQLYTVGKGLTAAGLGTDETMKRLGQFEDVAGGNAGNMDQFLSSYMHIRGTGEANFHMLQPLLGMGFNPAQILAEKHHKTQQYYNDELKDSTHGLKLFNEALDIATGPGGMFYKMQERVAETPGGKYIVAKTNWENTKAEFGEEMMPVVGELLESLKPSMTRLPVLLHELIPHIKNLGEKAVGLIDWGTTHTHAIKEMISGTWSLIKGMAELKVAMILMRTGKSFMGGLAGAGEGALLGGAGEGVLAGGIMSGLATGGLAVAGVYIANQIWDAFEAQSNRRDQEQETKEAESRGDYSRSHTRYNIGIVPDIGLPTLPGDNFGKYAPKKGSQFDESSTTPSTPAADAASDEIVGGGRKVVNMNFHAPLYKVDHQVFQNIKDAINDFEPKVKEALLRILYGVPGMM